jgi:hypothetical protein
MNIVATCAFFSLRFMSIIATRAFFHRVLWALLPPVRFVYK